ncbi:hypothetical protein WR25_00828 [Diploscapter pachys]|uniref:NR LBD domain-containing protein n=1 Tax=Diploscapter pachys TaxID=2018661 RepID=A0A2A2JVG3_9BILA|nr:hypothetical protein WR25_00828 [Diploscapter pachys]
MGNGNCPVSKGVRCACRSCSLSVGMNKNAIQNDRDRIGYTKRKRKNDKGEQHQNGHTEELKLSPETAAGTGCEASTSASPNGHIEKDVKIDLSIDPFLEKLTQLEDNFTLLLSRGKISTYDSLDAALSAPSRFLQPINVDLTDPIVISEENDDKMPFWRQRLIALYIDWAKTFSTFRNLPYADKIALITNHASSYMIMCEAFRTPEHKPSMRKKIVENCIKNGALTKAPREVQSRMRNYEPNINGSTSDETAVTSPTQPRTSSAQSHSKSPDLFVVPNLPPSSTSTPLVLRQIKLEPSDSPEPRADMIQLPTEYGSLPADYGLWIPKDYGVPSAGLEGRASMHNFFDAREFCEGRPSTCSFSEQPTKTTTLMVPRNHLPHPAPIETTLSGITPVIALMIDLVMKPFRQLNISTTEFAALQTIMFFDPSTEGLDAASQRNVAAEQKKVLATLFRHLQKTYNPNDANDRYASILLRVPTIRRAAAKKNESLQVLDMLKMHEINLLVKETSLGIRPASTNPPNQEDTCMM